MIDYHQEELINKQAKFNILINGLNKVNKFFKD